jgi:hypothetical protein
VIHVDGLVAREQKLPVDLIALVGMCFLLSYPYENNPIAYTALLAQAVGDVVLPLAVLERVDRYIFSRSAIVFTAWRNFSVTRPSTTDEGTGLPNCFRMKSDSPPPSPVTLCSHSDTAGPGIPLPMSHVRSKVPEYSP